MNVLRLITRFNTVSMWVATSILKVATVKARGKLMGKFIKIAEVNHFLFIFSFLINNSSFEIAFIA